MAHVLLAVYLTISSAIVQADLGQTICTNPTSNCLTYGVDFQNGGTYFQNTLSSDDFTFISQFSGCTNDTAQNILVSPTGAQFPCSNTSLTPDFTNQQSTCEEAKSSLTSGEWSLLILSNNNNGCAPLAAQRSFSISAGPQSTVTFTPTVTLTSTTTPIVTSTTTETITVTVTPPGRLVRRDAGPTTTTLTTAETTHTILHSEFSIPQHALVTSAIPCSIPPRASAPDPAPTINPTILPPASQANRRRAATTAPLVKRAPDPPTVTVTDTNTADFATSTLTITAPALTSLTDVKTTVTVTAPPPSATSDKGGPGWGIGYETITETIIVPAFHFSTTFVIVIPTITLEARPTGCARG